MEDKVKAVKPKKTDAAAAAPEKVLDIEEARRLAAEVKDPTIRLMVTFLLSTGVRVSEMLGLRVSDLKPATEELVQVRVKGRANKERTIRLKKAFVDRLSSYFHGQVYLFEHQGRPYNRVSVTNRITHETLRVLGREVTAQQLRQAWAAIQISRGRDVNAVAAVLGHADPGAALRTHTNARLKPEEAYLDLEEAKPKGRGKTRTN